MAKTSNQILEELWACRERELIQNIAKGRDIDFQSLIDEFASKTAKQDIQSPIIQDKKTKKIREVPHLERCHARVWDSSKSCPGGQCSRKGGKGPAKDLCGNHAKGLEKNGELPQGRIEDENQEKMNKVVEQQVEQVEEQQDEQVEQLVDKIVQEQHEEQVVEEESLSDSSNKKKRGRPKGFTKKSTDTSDKTQHDEELVEEEQQPVKVVKKEDKQKSPDELSKKILDSLQNYIDGVADLSDIKWQTAKKALTAKIGSFECDTQLFKSAFKNMIEKTKLKREEEDEESEDDEEEITTKEITVDGKQYLLDPKTLKIYDSTGDHDFLGKYDGNSIDFDAECSDDE